MKDEDEDETSMMLRVLLMTTMKKLIVKQTAIVTIKVPIPS